MEKARRNNTLIDTLSSYFVRRGLTTTARDASISTFLSLPGLRGFWPMSSSDELGYAYDLSGQGRLLTYNGNPTYGIYNLAPYINMDGTGDYLSRADENGLDITGTETSIVSTMNGITLGGWFWFDTADTIDVLIGKCPNTTSANYLLDRYGTLAGDPVRFLCGSTASTDYVESGATNINTWYFCCGRFRPGRSIDLFLNDVMTRNTTGVPASASANVSGFAIGATGGGGNLLDGRASLCFLCAAALPDWEIRSIYHSTRALFGVRVDPYA